MAHLPAHAGERLVRENGRPLRTQFQAILNTGELSSCGLVAAALRTKEQVQDLKKRCSRHEFAAAQISAIKMSEDASVLAFAYDRALYVQEKTAKERRSFVISGAASKLANIVSLSLDMQNREIYVLTSLPTQILVFPIGGEGNLAPTRLIDNPELEGAESLSLDSAHNEIFVANPRLSSVQVLGRLAHKYGPRAVFSQEIKRSIVFQVKPQSVAYVSEDDRLAVVDQNGGIAIVNRLSSGLTTSTQNVSNVTQAFVIVSNKDSIEWINKDGSIGQKSLRN